MEQIVDKAKRQELAELTTKLEALTVPPAPWDYEKLKSGRQSVAAEQIDAYESAIKGIESYRRELAAKWNKTRESVVSEAVAALRVLGFASSRFWDDPKSRRFPPKRLKEELSAAIGRFIADGWSRDVSHKIDCAKREIEKARKHLVDEENSKRIEKARAESEALLNEAVQYLLAAGKKIGDDFTVSNAVQFANGMAFDLECAARNGGQPIRFNGDDYCEECEGWVPGSHRCCCGNRRVCWSASDYHSFKSPSIYPEAY